MKSEKAKRWIERSTFQAALETPPVIDPQAAIEAVELAETEAEERYFEDLIKQQQEMQEVCDEMVKEVEEMAVAAYISVCPQKLDNNGCFVYGREKTGCVGCECSDVQNFIQKLKEQ